MYTKDCPQCGESSFPVRVEPTGHTSVVQNPTLMSCGCVVSFREAYDSSVSDDIFAGMTSMTSQCSFSPCSLSQSDLADMWERVIESPLSTGFALESISFVNDPVFEDAVIRTENQKTFVTDDEFFELNTDDSLVVWLKRGANPERVIDTFSNLRSHRTLIITAEDDVDDMAVVSRDRLVQLRDEINAILLERGEE